MASGSHRKCRFVCHAPIFIGSCWLVNCVLPSFSIKMGKNALSRLSGFRMNSYTLSLLLLSDLHFSQNDSSDIALNRATKIAEAICSASIGSSIVILISGDVANRGGMVEYQTAIDFITRLREAIEEIAGASVGNVLIAPGNHDVLKPNEKSLEDRSDDVYKLELNKLSNFYTFAREFGCWKNDKVKDEHVIEYLVGGKAHHATFLLLNSAPFSTKTEDKGCHKFPAVVLSKINKQYDDDPLFVITHHSPEWFEDETRIPFERALQKSTDILFYGHEHRGNSYSLTNNRSEQELHVILAGTLSLSNEHESNFKLINIDLNDTNAYKYTETKYFWDSTNYQYVQEIGNNAVSGRLKTSTLSPSKWFLDAIEKNENNDSDFYRYYYAFPRLRDLSSVSTENDKLRVRQEKELHSFDGVLDEIQSGARCLGFKGQSGSGKTSLVNYLYLNLIRKGYSPLILRPDNSSGSITQTVKSLIQMQYGDSYEIRDEYEGLPQDKKILLIDDLNLIKRKKSLANTLAEMLKAFGTVVFTAREGEDWRDFGEYTGDVHSFQICFFTKIERDLLIRKRCEFKHVNSGQVDRLISTIDRAAHWHVSLFDLTPAFVVNYLEYFISNPKDMLSQEEVPFENILESAAQRMLYEACVKLHKGGVESYISKALVVLEQFALSLFHQRADYLDRKSFSALILKLADDREWRIIPKDMINTLIKSEILLERPNGFEVCFATRKYLAFFVARAIDTEFDCSPSKAWEDVERLLNEVMFSINEDIISLLTNLRRSPTLANSLVSHAKKYVENVEPLSLSKNVGHFSFEGLSGLRLEAPSNRNRSEVNRSMAALEEGNSADTLELSYSGVYDYNPEVVENNLVAQAFCTLKYIELAGSCLVKQDAILTKDVKESIRSIISDITPRAINSLVIEMDMTYDRLVEEVEVIFREPHLDPEDLECKARRFASTLVMVLCIGLTSPIAARATEEDTVDRLIEACKEDPINMLIKLNVLDYGERADEFCREVCSWALKAKRKGEWLEVLFASVIAGIYIIDHPNMTQSHFDKLVNGLFGGDVSGAKTKLLQQRAPRT